MVLTEEEKTEFKKKGEIYRKIEYEINRQMVKLELQKGKFEKELREAIPITPNGSLICKICYVQSMKYIGRTPQGGLSGREEIYECEICGHEKVGDSLF
jgi:hypothetical protein